MVLRLPRFLRLLPVAIAILLRPSLAAGTPVPTPLPLSIPEILSHAAKTADPDLNPFLNQARAERLRSQLLLQTNLSPASVADLKGRFATELLRAGQTRESISQWTQLLNLQRQGVANYLGSRSLGPVRLQLAIAWLRLGEQENCVSNHTTLSCILPLDPSARHRFPNGSSRATELLLEQLEENPGDLSARWLLNIAAMTLGQYPERVPAAWLIPPSAFRSDGIIPPFHDIAPALGLDIPELAGGCVAEDFDGDGNLDLVISSMGLSHPLRFFHNNADGTFTDRTREAGLLGELGGLNLLQTDFDNDGHPDLLVLRGGWMGRGGALPASLLRNRGDGTFENVTLKAGLYSPHPTQTAVWFDFDGDGWLDLFLPHESHDGDNHPCQLFRNKGDGTFTECAAATGVGVVGWVKGVTAGDFDNDGRPDLYISRLGQPNLLFRNAGPGPGGVWRFEDVTAKAGVAEPIYSFPTWFFDYDNDGFEDLFVCGYRATNVGEIAADYLGLPHQGERPRLYHNRGDGTFQDVTGVMGLDHLLLAMGSNFADFDNDGWLDFYLGTGEPDLATLVPNRLFRNDAGRRFQDVTTVARVGHLQKGHGVVFADFDNDGDLDLYEVLGGAFSGDNYGNVLFENPGNLNAWVKIQLQGVRANRPGIGARLKLTLTGPDGERIVHRTVGTGGSFGSSPLRQEIGLGNATRIKELVIQWPGSGTRQVLRDLEPRKAYRICETDPTPMLLPLRAIDLHRVEASHRSVGGTTPP